MHGSPHLNGTGPGMSAAVSLRTSRISKRKRSELTPWVQGENFQLVKPLLTFAFVPFMSFVSFVPAQETRSLKAEIRLSEVDDKVRRPDGFMAFGRASPIRLIGCHQSSYAVKLIYVQRPATAPA
jgi:hypothetical protein